MYSIDDTQNITATPSIISRDISTVTSHHGGPTQHETTQYCVTIDLHTLSEGWHKIAGYIGITVFLGENQLFGGLLDYRTIDPLYFAVGDLSNIQDTSPSPSPTSPKPSPIAPNSDLSSLTTIPETPTLTPDQLGSGTAVLLGFDWVQVATLVLLGVIVVLLIVVVVFLRKRSIK